MFPIATKITRSRSIASKCHKTNFQWNVVSTTFILDLYPLFFFFFFQNFPTQSIPLHVLILLTVKGFLIPPISLPLTQPQSNYHQLDVSSAPTCINLRLHRPLRVGSIHRNLLSKQSLSFFENWYTFSTTRVNEQE